MTDGPVVPSVRSAARSAVADLYYHAIRLVPVNLVWGLGFAAVTWLGLAGHPLLGLLLAPLLALPLVAIARLAGLIVRGQDVVLSDAWAAVRERPGRTLGVGVLIIGLVTILVANVVAGLAAGSALAIGSAVAAAWGLLALWIAALPLWVLLADPQRSRASVLDAVRSVGLLLLVRPLRLLAVAVVVTAALVVSTILMAALLTVGVAYAALLTARITLPAADQLARSAELASADR